ncbi:tetratricopeptide repeat protein [Actinosynnema sp. CS-041913]|uniref:tetratricopeptide repeat protein n=1 Tax=Actinosynnema sp. CS-041913 TaxID=3239917 RepID=UPI003D938CB5
MPVPDPERARSLDEFIAQLRLLKAWAGNPSVTAVTKRVHEQWHAAGRPRGEWPGRATVGDCFRVGRRRPNAELLVAIVRALVDDPEEVARWERVLGRIQGGREAAGHVSVQGRLPDDLAVFTDRAATPAVHGSAGGDPVSVFTGMAGVGKTALAVRVGHRLLARDPERTVLFANLRGFDPEGPPADPAAVLEAFLRLLGVPGDRVPRTLDGRVELYRRKLAATKALVVLDNARDEAQVEPLLPGSPTCLTLITSRTAPAGPGGVTTVPLPLFTPAEALDLLRRTAGADRVDADPAVVARIADLLGHLPLALSVIGRHLRDHPDWTPADYLPPLTALALEGGVRAALALSYESLPADLRRLLRLLARQPGPDIGAPAAAALAGEDVDTTQEGLRKLADAHLVECPTPGRHGFHDLVRAYAVERSRLDDPPTRTREALTRLADHYRHGVATAMDALYPYEKHRRPEVPPAGRFEPLTAAAARAWLDEEETNLLAVADDPDNPRHTADLSTLLWRHLHNTARSSVALAFHERALTATRALGDRAGEGHTHNHLGATHWRQGRFPEALDHYRQALAIARELGDRAVQGRVLNNIGIIHERQGRLSVALDHYHRALAVAGEVGDRASRSRTLNNIGNVQWGLGRHGEALASHQEALAIARDLGDRVNESMALNNIGNVHRCRGDHVQALEHFERSLAVARESGTSDEVGHGMTNLALACFRLGRQREATTLLAEALTIAREADNRLNEGYALTCLGVVHHGRGRHAEAIRHHRRAIAIAEEAGDHTVRLLALNNLGEALCGAMEPAEAIDVHRSALLLAEDAGDSYERARALTGLGDAHQAAGDPVRAAEHWRRAVVLYEDMGLPDASQLRARLEPTRT